MAGVWGKGGTHSSVLCLAQRGQLSVAWEYCDLVGSVMMGTLTPHFHLEQGQLNYSSAAATEGPQASPALSGLSWP